MLSKIEKPINIITGGPGFGKSALIEELRSRGYLCCNEFARDLIRQQLATNGELLPWKDAKGFQQEILRLRLAFFDSVPEGVTAFADRGIPDQLAFARYRGFTPSPDLAEQASRYRYASTVWVTPPWPEIYVNDPIRQETFEEAILIHQAVMKTFSALDYQMIELPLVAVKERADFICQTLQNNRL
ncbi:MAG TPA: AAA family ATPase [Prolixibacteraceae bacterium]|nr:AAA family ATPase [Prolixibacteraceae bacterium]